MTQIRSLRSMPTAEMALWAAVLRLAVTSAVGVFFAVGIARLSGAIYVCWFALTLLMIAVELGLSVWRFVSSWTGVRWVSFEGGLVAMGVLWFSTAALLLAPASVRAFWRPHSR